MKESIQIMLVAAAIFAAGLVSGVWTQEARRAGEPAPGFGGPPPPPSGGEERLRQAEPELAAYRRQVDALRIGCRREIAAVLDAGQRDRFARLLARLDAEAGRRLPPPGGPFRRLLDAGGPIMGPLQGDGNFVSLVVYAPFRELLAAELGLTSAQQAKVGALLAARRAELLALVDRETPPNLLLVPTLLDHGPGPGPGPDGPPGPPR